MELNPPQQEASVYIDGPLLVIAGAGSGKTRVITTKITHLIKECGYAANSIAAVTFTNKSSREMKERVRQLIPSKASRGLTVSTFHHLGLTMLRKECKSVGLKSTFTILDSQDSCDLVKELIRDYPLEADTEAKKIQWKISSLKNDMITPEQAMANASLESDYFISKVYHRYQEHLQAYNAVDFDDLILKPVHLLQNNVDVREKWQNKLRYLLVDEYQDTNMSQYELVKLLAGVRGQFTVVGDDDQSIYAWRGARPENLMRLATDYPALKIIKLEQNYRSSKKILRSANTLIANNPHAITKNLWSDLAEGPAIQAVVCQNDEDEAKQCVSMLLHHKFNNRSKNSEYAILYRGNHQARILEKYLRESSIPYLLSGGTSFFAKTEVKDIMSYLRLLVNPEDDSAFLRVINTPRREIGTSTIQKLSNYATSRNCSLFAAIYEFGLEQTLKPKAVSKLRQFGDWLNLLSDNTKRGDLIANVRQMVRDIDYPLWCEEQSETPRKAEAKMENVDELIQWLTRMHEDQDKDTLEDCISHLALVDILEKQNEEEDDDDRVYLMTLHASKGLEFPHVFIVGMEEEILPHRSSIEEDSIEEERRLAYVGITRAQKSLTFLMAARRRIAGELRESTPRRFLDELPKDDIEWMEKGKPSQLSEEERKKRGQDHLANLKAMLTGD